MIKLTDKQKKYLKQSGIMLAYIYGSYARGQTNRLSDIDIAVLLENKINPKKYGQLKIKMNNFFMNVFKRDDVFTVILNQATPLLKHEVIKDGHLLYAQDKSTETNFMIQSTRQYEDTKPLRFINNFYLKQRAKLGKLGDKLPGKSFLNLIQLYRYEPS